MLELLKDTALRGYCGVRTREALADQVVRESLRARRKLLRGGGNRRADIGLVKLLPALGDRGDQRDPEAAAPIAEEIGECV
jgi:hypothetical protein